MATDLLTPTGGAVAKPKSVAPLALSSVSSPVGGVGDVGPSNTAVPLPVTPTVAPTGPSTQIQSTAPVPTAITEPATLAPLPFAPTGSVGNGVTTTPTNPNAPLTSQTLSVSPTVDRFKIAQDQYDAAVKGDEPRYQADLRSAGQRAFGAGRGVSGALRTSLGDATNARDARLGTERTGFLSDALKGTIGDAYNNVGIAQQQQGFQAGQQGTAFGEDLATKQLQESLTNGSFQRALQQLTAGNANDPSQIALVLSQIFGNQATGAGNAASGLFGQQGKASGADQLPAWLTAILNGTKATTDTGTTPSPTNNLTP